MASIAKRTKSQYWTACYTDRNGRQLKRSTKTTDRRHAMEIALELERVEQQARQGALTTTQLRKVLSDVSEKVTGDSLATPTIAAYLDEWLAGVEARSSPTTLERYRNTVRLFLANLGPRAQRPVTALTGREVETFLTWRLNTGAASKTAVVDIKTLNSAFRRAEAYGMILKNPVTAVRLPKVES